MRAGTLSISPTSLPPALGSRKLPCGGTRVRDGNKNSAKPVKIREWRVQAEGGRSTGGGFEKSREASEVGKGKQRRDR